MNKSLGFFIMFATALLLNCIKEPVAWYEDVGIVEITTDTTITTFHVPDTDTGPGNPGWNPWGNGSASQDFTIKLKEKSKKDVAVSTLRWQFFDVNGTHIASRSETYVPPIEIDGGKEYTYTVSIIVDERIADDLDDEDGAANDYYGRGTIKFIVEGYDLIRGEEINCIYSYTPIEVRK
ncbi:MAG: hypothetical protein N3A65_07795 [candidate division WOR-3 bacterium]|nr:hypothetical protein [candidate division WOR-3 bacterium]